jgi:hypothetical protein
MNPMDDYDDEKQKQRKSSRRRPMNNRYDKKSGNKKYKVVRNETGDFYPNGLAYPFQSTEIPSLRQQISMISQDSVNDHEEYEEFLAHKNENDVVFSSTVGEVSINQVFDSINFPNWINTDRQLEITPAEQRYTNYADMLYECCRTRPVVDKTVDYDLRRSLNNPSTTQLLKMIRCFMSSPHRLYSEGGQLLEKAKNFNLPI